MLATRFISVITLPKSTPQQTRTDAETVFRKHADMIALKTGIFITATVNPGMATIIQPTLDSEATIAIYGVINPAYSERLDDWKNTVNDVLNLLNAYYGGTVEVEFEDVNVEYVSEDSLNISQNVDITPIVTDDAGVTP